MHLEGPGTLPTVTLYNCGLSFWEARRLISPHPLPETVYIFFPGMDESKSGHQISPCHSKYIP